MKFIKIDEKTVRCLISKEEMDSYNLELEDFIKKNKKVKDFVELLIDKAGDEVGYEHSNGMMQLQLQPLPQMGLAITFSSREVTPEEFSKEIALRLGNEKAETFLETINEMEKNDVKNEVIKVSDKNAKQRKSDSNKKAVTALAIYRFDDLHDIGAFCERIPKNYYVEGSVYKDERNHLYYLVIEKGRCKNEKYISVCRLALEFAYLDSGNEKRLAFIKEQYSCITEKNAFPVFRKIYKK